MSIVKVDTIKPVTSGADLSLQGDSGGAAVDCLNIDSSGDVDFSGNTNAKIKLPSAGGIYESDGSTPILTESGGVVSLQNVIITGGGTLSNVFRFSITSGNQTTNSETETVAIDSVSFSATSGRHYIIHSMAGIISARVSGTDNPMSMYAGLYYGLVDRSATDTVLDTKLCFYKFGRRIHEGASSAYHNGVINLLGYFTAGSTATHYAYLTYSVVTATELEGTLTASSGTPWTTVIYEVIP
jgi:hypothetical protein